jgi:hypothetical protein
MIEYTLLIGGTEILYQGGGGTGLYKSYLRYIGQDLQRIRGSQREDRVRLFQVCDGPNLIGVNLVVKMNGKDIVRLNYEETFKFMQDLLDFSLHMNDSLVRYEERKQ